ncbi:ankyrin repeat domain-containing protein [Candidatus Dependentiae bacterium]|nr:ankyrin repeat domain-containing protein [Candidatus Dependentiae bacterium]
MRIFLFLALLVVSGDAYSMQTRSVMKKAYSFDDIKDYNNLPSVKKVNHVNNVLIRAAKEGNVKKIREALANGADINKDSKEGIALCEAVRLERLSAVAALLADVNIDINIKNKDGLTPLHLALVPTRSKGVKNYKIARLLLSCGADYTIKDSLGETALGKAVRMSLAESDTRFKMDLLDIVRAIERQIMHPKIMNVLFALSQNQLDTFPKDIQCIIVRYLGLQSKTV